MRIAYFAHVNGGSKSGVFHKILGQVGLWRLEGHTVRMFIMTRDDPAEWVAAFGDATVIRYGGPLIRMLTLTRLIAAIRAYSPDIMYQRWDVYYPQMSFVPRRCPVVAEVNTDDIHESSFGSRARATYNLGTRRLTLRRAKAIVFVTRELSDRPAFRRYRGQRCVVTNGIDLSAYPSLPAPSHGQPRLVFVGSAGQPWHGLDKLIHLATIRPEWQFDIVGTSDAGRGPPNVTWHGQLERSDVLKVLAGGDVGVGTLALHRNGINEASTLKVREYLAVGLPVLYGYRDPDADSLGVYSLSINNSETNIDDNLASIDTFVHESRGMRVPREAVLQIDVSVKERQRLALFEDVVS